MKKLIVLVASLSLMIFLSACSTPEIQLNGEQIVSIELGEKYRELGAKVVDRDDSYVAVPSGEVDETSLGTYYITYTANVDGRTYSVVRTVNVTAPELTDVELFILRSSLALKSSLRNSSSFELVEIGFYFDSEYGPMIDLKIGGENAFGAMTYKTYTIYDFDEFSLITTYDFKYDVYFKEAFLPLTIDFSDEYNILAIQYYIRNGELPD